MLSMTTYNMNTMMTNREMAAAVVVLPFQAVKRFFVDLMMNTARARQLAALNELSDADLEARGVTRAEAAQLILRSQF
jgi:uncharacterized protein YjiS (DUF1127 family)